MAFRPLREFVLNFLEAITSSRKLLREENFSDPNSLSPCGLQVAAATQTATAFGDLTNASC